MRTLKPRNPRKFGVAGPFQHFPPSKQIHILNGCYSGLLSRRKSIESILRAHGLRYTTGFYNNHSVRAGEEWGTEIFPIPVISVQDICDIGVDLNQTFVEGNLGRSQAILFDYRIFDRRSFSVYGCEAFLEDFYREGMELEGIGRLIEASPEESVGITVELSTDVGPEEIIDIIHLFQREGIRYFR